MDRRESERPRSAHGAFQVYYDLPAGYWVAREDCPHCGGPLREADRIEGLPILECARGCGKFSRVDADPDNHGDSTSSVQ